MVCLCHQAAQHRQEGELNTVHPVAERLRAIQFRQSCDLPQAEDVDGKPAKKPYQNTAIAVRYLISSERTERILLMSVCCLL